MLTLYHFTAAVTSHASSILARGAIETTESNASLERVHAGPPVVWLTDSPEVADIAWSAVMKKGARFTVEVDGAVRWLDWADARGYPVDWLVRSGGGIEAASHWFVRERPIHKWDVTEFRLLDDAGRTIVSYADDDLGRLFRSSGARRRLNLPTLPRAPRMVVNA
jgi:hypothetical protein